MSNTRIYVVSDTRQDPAKCRLVRASTRAQARNHAARVQYEVDVAGQETLVDLLTAGVPIENAVEDEAQQALPLGEPELIVAAPAVQAAAAPAGRARRARKR